jgi:hypothetical protein
MKLSQLKQDQTYLLCIHIEYVLVHDSIRWYPVWPQSISPQTSPARCARARVAVPGLLEPRWSREGAVSHVGAALAAPGRRAGRPHRATALAGRATAGADANEYTTAWGGREPGRT